ncbi:hypothetical protein GCM10027194_26300 [Thalassiella azotivora]
MRHGRSRTRRVLSAAFATVSLSLLTVAGAAVAHEEVASTDGTLTCCSK